MGDHKINVLSEETIGKISAGEVVERPASVVKELVENAIDAGSDSIEIEIHAAGRSLIRVADNGEGMTPEDAKIACMRHTTSKIRDINDLEHVYTLGFRGEALSSIAAVSQMDLTSCAGSAETGVYMYLESGNVQKIRPVGRSRGTTVEVRNLFYNVPARRKFLKKESTELAEIVNVVGRFIVSCPDIEIKLVHGEKRILHAPKGMDLHGRIRLVLGGDISDQMIDVSANSETYKLSGYISRPSSTRKDKRAQLFFVNGRFIRSRVLGDAVYDAYRSMLERGRYPFVALFLKMSSSEIDVNVHPTKLQVKFGDEKTVRNVITAAIKDRFEQIKREEVVVQSAELRVPGTGIGAPESPVSPGSSEVQTEFSYEVPEGIFQGLRAEKGSSRGEKIFPEDEDIFQMAGCYIVQVKPGGITVTDQHAAHERVLYEFFSKAAETGPVETQNLLFPVRLDLSADESVIMEKTREYFGTLGFQVEPFGTRTYVVQAVPAVIKDRDVQTVIHDILTDLSSYDLSKIAIVEELIKVSSCRAAVKAGDALSKEEMISLLDQLQRCALPFTCPHGRPTMSEITVDELEKRFRRK